MSTKQTQPPNTIDATLLNVVDKKGLEHNLAFVLTTRGLIVQK